MHNKLLVLNPEQYMEVQFEQQITIGRDVYNSLSLQDPEVSRSHAIIFDQEGEMILKDLKSRNGCYVRGDVTEESVLHPGDEIILGSTVIIYEPAETYDLEELLSKRGRYLLEQRGGGLPKKHKKPITAYTATQMEEAVDSIFSDPENTTFFSMANAVMLLQAFKEMNEAANAMELFDSALRRALTMIGGHRGVIVETDESRKQIKVRSVLSVDNEETVQIAKAIMKVVLSSEKSVYCSNIHRDARFEKVAEKCRRPIHSFLAVPIVSQGTLYGSIYLESEDASISYDFTALRSLYFLTAHIAALLRNRPMHFQRHSRSISVAD